MKKRRPLLLPLLSLGLAAVVASMLLTRSCTELRKDDGARTAQRRAFAAAPPEANGAANGVRRDGRENRAGGVTRYAEAARRRAAQREFLTEAARTGAKTPEDSQKIMEYYDEKREWLNELYYGNGENGTDTQTTGQQMMRSRELLHRGSAERSLLTPEAQKKWDEWEAKQWRDYPFSDDWEKPQNSSWRTTPAHLAEADFVNLSMALTRPLLDELEYLEDMANDLAREREAQQKLASNPDFHGTDSTEERIIAEQLQIVNDRALVTAHIDSLAAYSSEMRQLWKKRGWEGYVMPAAGAGAGRANTFQKAPGYVSEAEE